MDAVQEIFSEYVRMRQNGLESGETLMALREYIDPLHSEERQKLALELRAWEIQKGDQNVAPPIPPQKVTEQGEISEGIWIECANCSKKNRAIEVFCYSCGRLLQDTSHLDTRRFSSDTDALFSQEFFGDDSILILSTEPETGRFEIRPQTFHKEVIIGRSTSKQKIRPNIDLKSVQGAELGVSRLHSALIYDREKEYIQIRDLGSANGTYINGQQLHPSETRVLRNGDELYLGQLKIIVTYEHPGQEIF